jgi:hypothetical protein
MSIDLLIVEKYSPIGNALILIAERQLGLTTYLTEDGEEALRLLEGHPDNLPKGVLVDSRLFSGERDLSLEIFQYLKEQGATENFRYACVSKPEYHEREIKLQEQTGAKFIVKGDICGPLGDFMAGLARKKD